MPAAKRRRVDPSTATKSQQSTITFQGSKAGRRSTVDNLKAVKIEATEIVSEDGVLPAAQAKPEKQPLLQEVEPDSGAEAETPESDEEDEDRQAIEAEARKLPQTKIKAYWAGKERERKAPRVHQQGLSIKEKILREFDMSSRFG